MSPFLLRVISLKRMLFSAFFMLLIASILIGMFSIGSLAADDPDHPFVGPKAVIQPQSNSYGYTASPRFEVGTGSNMYYKVELALAKKLFDSSYGNRITSSSDIKQNFYSSGFIPCDDGGDIMISAIATKRPPSDCWATFEVTSSIWKNLRGSRVFYRVITATDSYGSNSTFSTADSDWGNAPYIGKTGESWFGLPHNDQAKIGQTYVVVDGKLNGKALESDYGPRNVAEGSRFHPGLDIPVTVGTPVYAIADGTVVSVPVSGDSMHRLDIDHGPYRSGYVHLDKAVVILNENVVAGQLIGYSGRYYEGDPNSIKIGAHLHFDSGYTTSQIFHNPMDYIRYTDEHVISNQDAAPDQSGTYLHDTNTHDRAIDIVPAAGAQDIILVAFGVTTDYDKDLNFVEVQVDNRLQTGQYFILNYNDIEKQDSNTGVVTLKNDTTFRILPLSYNIYGDTGLEYAFYVKPAGTTVDQVAKDYFYFPWNISSIKNQEDGGPHTIEVSLGEENDEAVPRSVTVGPDLWAIGSEASQNEMTLELIVTHYDIPEIGNGIIQLKVEGLPSGWSASFSDPNPSIDVDQSKTVVLTLRANPPYAISADAMRENNTRVVAAFGRIETLKDSYVICPSDPSNLYSTASVHSQHSPSSGEFCPIGTPKASIQSPTDGANVAVDKAVEVKVFAGGATTDADASVVVQNLSNGSTQTLFNHSRSGDTFTFQWTPDERVQYGLIAKVSGFEDSEAVTVTAVNDEVIFIQPTDVEKITGGEAITVIVDAPSGAVKVTLEIDPADPGSGGEMMKSADGTWQYAGWIPSKEVDYYNLIATAYMPDGSRPYAIIRVEPIPDSPTISVPSPVQLGDTVDVIVTAPRAFSVTLFGAGGDVDEIGQEGYIWRYQWTPNAMGEFIVWANASYAGHPDQQTEQVKVQVIDENNNAIVVKITSPAANASVGMGVKTVVEVESPGEMTKVELEITNPNGTKQTITYTSSDLGGNFSKVGIPWTPSQTGTHYLKASGWDPRGYKGWSEDIPVQVVSNGKWMQINEFTYLWENSSPISGLRRHGYGYMETVWQDTGISASNYVCGIVGYESWGGDIGEKTDKHDIIDVFAVPSGGTWRLMADLNTWHAEDWGNEIFSDRPESWNIKMLCFTSKVASYGGPQAGKPIFIKLFENLGDDVGSSNAGETNISTGQYICGMVGLGAEYGDIQENDSGNIIQAFLRPGDSTWQMRADFRSHDTGGDSSHEDWDLWVLCMDREWAAQDTPGTGKPFVFKTYKNQGDNISKPTEFDVSDWYCGISGFAALHGDIDESGSPNQLIDVRMSAGTEKWYMRADFRTHEGAHESWDIHMMCVARLSKAPPVLHAEPFLFTGEEIVNGVSTGKQYGPGMKLIWDETHNPDADFYVIQYSLDSGSTWKILNSTRDIGYGGWINHHGYAYCGHNFYYCLDPSKHYTYRVAVINDRGEFLTDWSAPVIARSFAWPAHVELAEPSPAGPYYNDEVVTLWLENTYGQNLYLDWDIRNWNDAGHKIISGCLDGYASNGDTTHCEIEIYRGGSVASPDGAAKLAALLPETSVEVTVTGKDLWGYTDSDYRILSFRNPNDDPDLRYTFSDVPLDHWANPYVEELYAMGITSGCTTEGDPEYCPEDPLLRAHMAVFTVRSRHLDIPGYVPPSPEQVIFIDEEAQWISNVASTIQDPVFRLELYYYDKYFQELYEDGVISGCNTNPMMVCPNDGTTRAEMTVFIVRLLHGENYVPPEPDQQTYHDTLFLDSAGNRIWYTKWVEQARKDGLVQACGTDMVNMLFRPEEEVTRAEAACMIYYALEARGE